MSGELSTLIINTPLVANLNDANSIAILGKSPIFDLSIILRSYSPIRYFNKMPKTVQSGTYYNLMIKVLFRRIFDLMIRPKFFFVKFSCFTVILAY